MIGDQFDVCRKTGHSAKDQQDRTEHMPPSRSSKANATVNFARSAVMSTSAMTYAPWPMTAVTE